MNKLGDRNYSLLSMGAKMSGNWVDAYLYGEEQFYYNEAVVLYDYCEWLENTGKSMGWGNYEERFKEYLETKKNENSN